jgi:hypothetical protein
MPEFEAFMLDFAALYLLTPRSARLSYATLQLNEASLLGIPIQGQNERQMRML